MKLEDKEKIPFNELKLQCGGVNVACLGYGKDWNCILNTSLDAPCDEKKYTIKIHTNEPNQSILITAKVAETNEGVECISTITAQFYHSKGEFFSTYGIRSIEKKELLSVMDKIEESFIGKRRELKVSFIRDEALFDSAIHELQKILPKRPQKDYLKRMGIRTVDKIEGQEITKGMTLGNSFCRIDETQPKELCGTSVLWLYYMYIPKLKNYLWFSMINQILKYRVDNEYIAIVEGEDKGRGSDALEHLFYKPKIVYLFDIVEKKCGDMKILQLRRVF